MTKILFILEYYYPNIGGVEKLFKDLCENLVKKGHEVCVITTRFNKDLAAQEYINGVEVIRLNLRNRFLFTFFSVFSIFPKAKKFDIIHTTSYNAAFPAWIIAKIYRKKSIITFHEVWGKLWKELPYLSGLQRFLFSSYEAFILKLKFDRYIAVSEFTKQSLLAHGIPENRVVKIYNGIVKEDYTAANTEKNPGFTFSFFGRLGVSKGLDLIIPAAHLFLKQHPEAKFNCIIPKTPKAFFKNILKELRPDDYPHQIRLLHHLSFDELQKEIAQSHCVLIPSYSEGFCFAAVEAGALNTPIISSGRGALKETVSGKHILMREQSAKAVSDALECAYQQDFSYKEKVEFPLEKTVNDYLQLYKTF